MPATMNPQVWKAVNMFTELVKLAYGDELVGIIAFGSQVRGDATENSDIDIAVILTTVGDRRSVRDNLSNLSYEVLLATSEDVRAVLLSQQQWDNPDIFTNPQLIHQIRREGYVIAPYL